MSEKGGGKKRAFHREQTISFQAGGGGTIYRRNTENVEGVHPTQRFRIRKGWRVEGRGGIVAGR